MRTQFNGARKQKTTDQHWASDSGVRPTFSVLCTRKNLRKQFLSRQFLLPADLIDRQTKQMAFQLRELLRAFGMTVVWEGKGSGIGAFVTVSKRHSFCECVPFKSKKTWVIQSVRKELVERKRLSNEVGAFQLTLFVPPKTQRMQTVYN